MIMNDTKSKTLLMRGLSDKVNEALEWGKEHFQVNTNTAAAERMMVEYRKIYEGLEKVIDERDECRRKLSSLCYWLRSRKESEESIYMTLDQLEDNS